MPAQDPCPRSTSATSATPPICHACSKACGSPTKPLVTPALAALTGGRRLGPPPEAVARDDVATKWIRNSAWTYHHPVGTCAMGLDPAAGAVVDPDARVHGVDGLSVADASILPEIPSANTNIPVIMVAEHVTARRRSPQDAGRAMAGAP